MGLAVILLVLFVPLFCVLLAMLYLAFILTPQHKFPYVRLISSKDIILGSTMKYISIPITQVRLDHEEREYHATIWGSTGSGKSFLLLNVFVQNFLKGNGVGLIDPHNYLSLDVLKQLIHHGAFNSPYAYTRLVYIDWGNALITPFNVLAGADDDQYDRDFLDLKPISATGKVLDMAYRVWPELENSAPAFKQYFQAAMMVLIANKLPLGHLHAFLNDLDFRNACLLKVKEPHILRTWEAVNDMKEADRQAVVGSAIRRAYDLISDPITQSAFSSPDNVIKHRQWMDEGVAFIHNIGTVQNPATRHILGALLLVDIEQSLKSRIDDPDHYPKPCTILVDEWQLFADQEKTIAHTLSETRKFGGRMYLATQSLGVIGSNRLQGALEQCNLNIAMKLGNDSAEKQAPQIAHYDYSEIKEEAKTDTQHNMFTGLFEQKQQWIDEIKNLRKRFAYVKILGRHAMKIKTHTVPKARATRTQLDEVLLKYRSTYQRTVPQAREKMKDIVLPHSQSHSIGLFTRSIDDTIA